MKKRIIALTLALAVCFCLMSMVAMAADLGEAVDTADGILTTISAFRSTFQLPDQINQLFDAFKFDRFQSLLTTIKTLLGVIM